MIHGFSVTGKQNVRKRKQEARPQHFRTVKIRSSLDPVKFRDAALETH